ncbi:reverse transcriptase domain, reverse transcriptase zinc-binding domain protein [Tanacetum coccineum]
MLRRKVRDSDGFRYHRYCSDLEIINLCFADDLFIFAHGDPYSRKILPFEEGRLPVKYLGVPLVSPRLVFRNCKELFDRIRSRINDWKNKSLSAAGRLQLVRSVLGSMHAYWASVFILPSRILLDIEQLMRGFLWCHGEMKKGRPKVKDAVIMEMVMACQIGSLNIPLLNSVAVPTLSAMQDRLEWRDRLEIVKPFSVNAVWNCIRPRDAVVNWYDVVWFANCIPSHAFHLWLVAKHRLKTQDLLRLWDVNRAVLNLGFGEVFGWSPSISIIVDLLIPFAKRRSARSVVAKLVVAACSYYIWQERNLRLFMNQKRSHSQVTDCIKSSIRLKLLSCTFKKSKDALLFKRLWNLPDSIFR